MKRSKSSGATRKADTKLAVKKTAAKGKAAKDPNKPKRPASAFFVFMLVAVLRLSLPSWRTLESSSKKITLTTNLFAAVGKAGGAKWKLKLY
uniref:Uncharacterized protein n=1 Tax=Lactuca sativa TaxID=4236 RepID=A0A9R1XLR0_LACSA|nr:hypothetical protein LSAT_V11C300152760 [Lactuca sativa]